MISTNKSLGALLVFFVGFLFAACIADPWPEPDSMKPNDSDRGTPGNGNDPTNQGEDGYGGETGKESDNKQSDSDNAIAATDDVTDTETASEIPPSLDSGTEVEELDDAMDIDKVFVSTSSADGFATIVGLAGAVGTADKVIIEVNGFKYDVPIGREGGFASRVPAASGDDILLIVTRPDGTRSVTERFIAGNIDATFGDKGIIGEGTGVVRVSENLVSLSGEGTHLSDGAIVIVGNITQHTGAITNVACYLDSCSFSMIISAVSGDVLDIFLMIDQWTPNDYSRAGTMVDTIIVD
jgi:hypothetical protein